MGNEDSRKDASLTIEQRAKVAEFLRGLGPYQSDVWSNSYRWEILEHLEAREKREVHRSKVV